MSARRLATKLRTGVVFGHAPAPLGAMWAELCDLEDRLAGHLAAAPPGASLIRGATRWTLRERDGMHELACGPLDDDDLAEFCSRFDIALESVDIDEEDLQRQIDQVLDALAHVERAGFKTA